MQRNNEIIREPLVDSDYKDFSDSPQRQRCRQNACNIPEDGRSVEKEKLQILLLLAEMELRRKVQQYDVGFFVELDDHSYD